MTVAWIELESPSQPVAGAIGGRATLEAGKQERGSVMQNATMVVATKDPELRDQLSAAALGAGHRLNRVFSGFAGQVFGLARRGDVRLVVLDDTVGAGAAMRLVRRCKAARPELTIVYVSSAPDPVVEVQLRQLGVLYLMVRPVSYPLLTRILQTALESDTRRYSKTASCGRTAVLAAAR